MARKDQIIVLFILLRRTFRENQCQFDASFCSQLLNIVDIDNAATNLDWPRGPLSPGVPQQPYYTYLAEAFREWALLGEDITLHMETQMEFSGIEVIDRPIIGSLTQAVCDLVDVLDKFISPESLLRMEEEDVGLGCAVEGCFCKCYNSTPCKSHLCWCTHPFTVHGLGEENSEITKFSEKMRMGSIPMIRKVLSSLTTILSLLGKGGILFLLGCRKTVGTLMTCQPPLQALLKSFNSLHQPMALTGERCKPTKGGIRLSVGARALSKHFHRSQDCWWGDCKGSEAQKNKTALAVVKKILKNAVWMNVHWILGGYFYEVRIKEGYGARWQYCEPFEFRGFLEPQMEDGHEKGWRH